jgi:hypothetical protein
MVVEKEQLQGNRPLKEGRPEFVLFCLVSCLKLLDKMPTRPGCKKSLYTQECNKIKRKRKKKER